MMTISTPPRAWNHAEKCRDYGAAVQHRDELQREHGQFVSGKRVRWRVRRCAVCGGYAVKRDASGRGTSRDRKGT
jgi:hypothetical protein